jgi:hypothetical protein
MLSSTIGIRLDKETEERIETISASLKLKKSQLIRRAFNEWAKTRENIFERNMMLCENLLVASLFECLESDEITHITNLMADLVISKIRIGQIKRKAVNESIIEFLEYWTTLLSPERFGWFEDFNFSHTPNNQITIYGFHSINLPYSQYAVKLISRILTKLYEYQSDTTTENVTENSFIIRLKPD